MRVILQNVARFYGPECDFYFQSVHIEVMPKLTSFVIDVVFIHSVREASYIVCHIDQTCSKIHLLKAMLANMIY